MSVTLYSYWRSSCSWRLRIALAYKKVEYEYKAVHLVKDGGEQHQSAYKDSVNPMGAVPALVIDGHTLTQSMAILEYLEETRPQPVRLLPEDPVKRATVRALCQVIASDTQPVQNLSVLLHAESVGGNKKEWGHWAIQRSFVGLEQLMAKSAGTYSVGDQVSLADVCLVPQCYNARRFGVDLTQFPTIERVEATLVQLPEFQAAHPDQQPDKQ